MMEISSGTEIGSYTIDRLLSRKGGMSNVYLAHETERPNYMVVVKLQKQDDQHSATFQDLLRDEARLLSKLRHPGVVRIYPVRHTRRVDYAARAIQLEGHPWFYAMEYLAGDSLDNQISSLHQKMGTAWTVELYYQLLTTIYYMHKVGYAHCDLKPGNLFLRYSPDRRTIPTPVIVDFGSASSIRRGIGRLALSPRYAPPEALTALARDDLTPQELNLQPDRIDIWSLGTIFFELLTGQPLINTRNLAEISTTLARGRLARIRDIRPELHESLDKLLAQMLSRQVNDRPNIKEVIQAVEERIHSIRPPRIAR